MIQFFVLVAVALGIASTLAISAVQKTRQIGILKAMGMRDRSPGASSSGRPSSSESAGRPSGSPPVSGSSHCSPSSAATRTPCSDHTTGGVHRDLVRRRRAGRGGLFFHPVPAHVEARSDRGDPGWLNAGPRGGDRQDLRHLSPDGRAARGVVPDRGRGIRLGHRPVRLRQVHAAQPDRSVGHATTGRIVLNGHDATAAGRKQRAALAQRPHRFVFQFHYLLPEFSVLENVLMPGRIAGRAPEDLVPRAKDNLALLGLEGSRRRTPTTSPAARSSAWPSLERS